MALPRSTPPSSSVLRLAAAAALLALAPSAIAQTSVYIPGDIENQPGASISLVAAGADGFTTYDILGATLAENAQSAIMTEYGALGATAYACQFGADAMATCQVSQFYDGTSYDYTEAISYFTGPGADAGPTTSTMSPTSTSLSSSTTSSLPSSSPPSSTTAAAPVSRTSAASSVPTADPSSSSSPGPNNGPAPGQAQPTSANIFTGAASSNRRFVGDSVAVAAFAGAIGLAGLLVV